MLRKTKEASLTKLLSLEMVLEVQQWHKKFLKQKDLEDNSLKLSNLLQKVLIQSFFLYLLIRKCHLDFLKRITVTFLTLVQVLLLIQVLLKMMVKIALTSSWLRIIILELPLPNQSITQLSSIQWIFPSLKLKKLLIISVTTIMVLEVQSKFQQPWSTPKWSPHTLMITTFPSREKLRLQMKDCVTDYTSCEGGLTRSVSIALRQVIFNLI